MSKGYEMLSDQVAIAKTRIILSSVKINVVASLITATMVLLILGREQPLSFLLPWYVVFVVMTVFRLIHSNAYDKTELNEHNYKEVISHLTLLTLTAGSLWGILGFYSINSENLTTSIVLLMIFTGLVANAAATLSYILPTFMCFIFPIMLPPALKFYSFGEAQFYWITALILFYLAIVLINTRGIRSSLKQSIELRFANLELIEDLKVQNAKTQAALDVAEQANLAKSRFFAAASHDLRQPLQSLSMFTATLAAQSEESGQKKIVSQIEKSVQSLEGLFNALLDISSLDAGTLKVRKQHFALQDEVNRIAGDFSEVARAKSLSINIVVKDEVVYTDPVLFGRIVRNLLENAVRYTQEGKIEVRSVVANGQIRLSIGDTGIGISKDMQSRIFGEFVQLNNPERDRNKGLGLGLSIVRRICTMLDVQLSLDSDINKGTTFTLGIERGDRSEIAKQTPSLEPLEGVLDLFVLIIDDEEDVRLSLEGLLLTWGCVVMVASSGGEAIQQIKEYGACPDVLISDYRLRNNETGADAIAMVRLHCDRSLPAIIVTGDIDPERLIEMDNLNIPVLHKPCNTQQLRSLLQAEVAE